MKRATSLWAFGATTVVLGSIVWFALLGGAQTTDMAGNVAVSTEAHLPVVTLGRGETLQVYGLNKSTAGPALNLVVQFLDANGFELKPQACQAPPGGFCSASFTDTECVSQPCQVWTRVTVEPLCVARDADGGSVPTVCEWSATAEVLDHRGSSKFAVGPIPNFLLPSFPGPGTDGGGAADGGFGTDGGGAADGGFITG